MDESGSHFIRFHICFGNWSFKVDVLGSVPRIVSKEKRCMFKINLGDHFIKQKSKRPKKLPSGTPILIFFIRQLRTHMEIECDLADN